MKNLVSRNKRFAPLVAGIALMVVIALLATACGSDEPERGSAELGEVAHHEGQVRTSTKPRLFTRMSTKWT